MNEDAAHYDKDFFNTQRDGSKLSSEIVAPLIKGLTNCQSVVDVGCGVGTWLSSFREIGCTDVLGIDGDYVERSKLAIPEAAFMPYDLTKPLTLPRRFDLAMSLEVGEHLQTDASPIFVKTLVDLSDVVLFSAAIPYQTGRNHINEQWLEFWGQLFAQHGYVAVDALRFQVWKDPRVLFWYAQNMLVYVKESRLADYPQLQERYKFTNGEVLTLIHPILLERTASNGTAMEFHAKNPYLHVALARLPKSIVTTVQKLLGTDKRWEKHIETLENPSYPAR